MTVLIGKMGKGKLKLPTLKDKISLDKSLDKAAPKVKADGPEVEVGNKPIKKAK